MQTRERTGVLCLKDTLLLTIEQQDPTTKKRFWSFPGGALEAGETPAQAAVRECLEETGYQVALIGSGFTNQYVFRWNGKIYDCTTHWFKAELISDTPSKVEDADYILQSKWLKWPRSRGLYTYNAAIMQALDQLLPVSQGTSD